MNQPTKAKAQEAEKRVPPYRTRFKAERSDALFVRILEHLTRGKLYRDPDYTSRRLAKELSTNTRYIAACVGNSTGDNYNALVNSLRLRDACQMLRSPRFAHLTAEEIGLLSGFSSRQAFYKVFAQTHHTTPRLYRLSAAAEKDSGKAQAEAGGHPAQERQEE